MPFYPSTDAEVVQFRKIVQFRKKLEKAGVLFWEYDTPLAFERFVREHLIRQIVDVTTRPRTKAGTKGKPRPSAGPLVFLSASREDLSRVRPIYDALSLQGFKPWLDVEELLPGQQWLSTIEQAINDAKAFLVFISRHSIRREAFVQREVQYALQLIHESAMTRKYLIPVRLDPVEPPLLLQQYQWVDVFEAGGVERLIAGLRELMKPRRGRMKAAGK